MENDIVFFLPVQNFVEINKIEAEYLLDIQKPLATEGNTNLVSIY